MGGAKTIGPIIWGPERLGAEMYRFGIDKNEDGCIDYYEVRAWNGERLVLLEKEAITDETAWCDPSRQGLEAVQPQADKMD